MKQLEEPLSSLSLPLSLSLPGRAEIESSKLVERASATVTFSVLLLKNHKKLSISSHSPTVELRQRTARTYGCFHSNDCPLINNFIVYLSDRLVLLMAFSFR